MCDTEREGAVRMRDASNRRCDKCTPTHDDRYIQKKNVSRLVEERIIKCAEAKELREWGLEQMSWAHCEISKNNDKNSDRKIGGYRQTHPGIEEKRMRFNR